MFGQPVSKVGEEIWQDIGPRIETVLRMGSATWDEGLLLLLERSGYKEETYHTFSYSPLPDDNGKIGGMLRVITENTELFIGERRLETNQRDLPITLTHLPDVGDSTARPACRTGTGAGDPIAPYLIGTKAIGSLWPAQPS